MSDRHRTAGHSALDTRPPRTSCLTDDEVAQARRVAAELGPFTAEETAFLLDMFGPLRTRRRSA